MRIRPKKLREFTIHDDNALSLSPPHRARIVRSIESIRSVQCLHVYMYYIIYSNVCIYKLNIHIMYVVYANNEKFHPIIAPPGIYIEERRVSYEHLRRFYSRKLK